MLAGWQKPLDFSSRKEYGGMASQRTPGKIAGRHRRLTFRSMSVFFADRDAALVFDANRFDDPHPAIGDGPIKLRQVPVSNLPARLWVNAGGRFLSETLRLTQ